MEYHWISQLYLYLKITSGRFGHGHGQFRFDYAREEPEETLGCTVPTGAWDTGCLSPTTLLQLIFHPAGFTAPPWWPADLEGSPSSQPAHGVHRREIWLMAASKSTAMTPCHTTTAPDQTGTRITASCNANCRSMSNSRLHALKRVHQLHYAFCKPSLSSAGVSKPSPAPKAGFDSTLAARFAVSSTANQRHKTVSPHGSILPCPKWTLVAGGFIAIFRWGGGTAEGSKPPSIFVDGLKRKYMKIWPLTHQKNVPYFKELVENGNSIYKMDDHRGFPMDNHISTHDGPPRSQPSLSKPMKVSLSACEAKTNKEWRPSPRCCS